MGKLSGRLVRFQRTHLWPFLSKFADRIHGRNSWQSRCLLDGGIRLCSAAFQVQERSVFHYACHHNVALPCTGDTAVYSLQLDWMGKHILSTYSTEISGDGCV